ncbi:hypothetical protein SELMODRAFT_230913 [Selaginella moellendorffii]|uniref:non-specific serine/threonine protein kinase n=1 Tax=Selaginella moellendorffii TaxID=88036 RepID=D8R560_SELML|nr:hypothetical protein SELMODRAFT_230913 [Selaginella moellendorffii]
MEQYEIIGQVGKGAFGSAILVNHKLEKKKYVLKKIRLARQSDRCRRSAHQEMALVSRVKHPHIVEYKEAWVEKGCYVCIVTGYCEGGDMADIIRKANGTYFPEERLCRWFVQLLLGVEYLHANHILHRDVKCSNIFLTKDHDIRLGDFGLAKMLKSDDLACSVVGTPNYMCPELLADIPYGFKSDIWSLGCCMYEMSAHRPAFKAFDIQGLINKINKSSIGPLPTCYSSSFKSLIRSMLRKNPEHRPTAAELLRHPHLQPYLLQRRRQENSETSSESLSKTLGRNAGLTNFEWLKHRLAKRHFEENLTDGSETQVDSGAEQDKYPIKSSPVRTSRVKSVVPSPRTPLAREAPPRKKYSKSAHLAGLKDLRSPDVSVNAPRLDKIPQFNLTPDESLCEAHDFAKYADSDLPRDMDIASLLDLKPDVEVLPISQQQQQSQQQCQHQGGGCGGGPSSLSATATATEVASGSEQQDRGAMDGTDLKSYRQRADALEGLLELSAQLLAQHRLEELAIVLKPFGGGAVSPRETAIWLTKSLKGMLAEHHQEQHKVTAAA